MRKSASASATATGLRAATSSVFGWQTIRYYIAHTGIPVNFGITITIALIVGTIVAGQTFYIFTLENLKQFGALKAIGVTNWRITGMILLQALMVGVIGYSHRHRDDGDLLRGYERAIWICGFCVVLADRGRARARWCCSSSCRRA